MIEFRFVSSCPKLRLHARGRLYGSSYYTGVSNIFRYEVATGKIEAVSNAESGFFRPVPLADGRLVVFHYTAAGFVPATIEPRELEDVGAITFLGAEVAEKHPVVKTWGMPPPSTVDHEKLVIGSGPYVPLRNLAFQSATRCCRATRNTPAWVITRTRRSADPRHDRHHRRLTPSRDLPKDYASTSTPVPLLGWHADLSWNRPDFYDLFGPTIRSRRGFAAKAGYDEALVFDEPRRLDLKTELAYYDNLDALPQSQNVRATASRLLTGEAGLYFTDVRKSRGAVDDEKGVCGVVLGANYADSKPGPAAARDTRPRLRLPFGHSSVWLRNAAGIARGESDDPYANWFLGGFGNNYVDSRTEKRYREYQSFPGFELNEIAGRRFTRHMVEANLPPVVFESLGTPALHLTWLRPAVFAPPCGPSRQARARALRNAGAQVDLNFTVLHWYSMTLSFGYAVGYRGRERAGDEWMVSLKVL